MLLDGLERLGNALVAPLRDAEQAVRLAPSWPPPGPALTRGTPTWPP
jgi:hypothetical protein